MTRRQETLSNVAEAIAEVEGCSPTDLDYSLYDHVETEALTALAASDHADWQLRFRVPDHTVEVRANGQILVDGVVVRDAGERSQEVS